MQSSSPINTGMGEHMAKPAAQPQLLPLNRPRRLRGHARTRDAASCADVVVPHAPALTKRRDHGFYRQKQRTAILRIFDEFSATEIEAPGGVVFRMHQHGAYANALRGDGDTPQGVCEEVGAEPFARVAPINRQTPDDGDRNRVGRIASNLARRRRTGHSPGADAVPGYDLPAMANDVSPRKTAFVFQSAMAKPIIEFRLAAVEA